MKKLDLLDNERQHLKEKLCKQLESPGSYSLELKIKEQESKLQNLIKVNERLNKELAATPKQRKETYSSEKVLTSELVRYKNSIQKIKLQLEKNQESKEKTDLKIKELETQYSELKQLVGPERPSILNKTYQARQKKLEKLQRNIESFGKRYKLKVKELEEELKVLENKRTKTYTTMLKKGQHLRMIGMRTSDYFLEEKSRTQDVYGVDFLVRPSIKNLYS